MDNNSNNKRHLFSVRQRANEELLRIRSWLQRPLRSRRLYQFPVTAPTRRQPLLAFRRHFFLRLRISLFGGNGSFANVVQTSRAITSGASQTGVPSDAEDSYDRNSPDSRIMKRNSEMSAARGQKRMRSGGGEEPALRILIPSKVAGSIIGKGGKNISKLRQDFNATIQVPDCSGPERVVSISADMDTAINIVSQIIPCLEETFTKGEVDLRLLVHQSLAGCVIGKAGAKVKELREKTLAKIKIFGQCCPQSTDRVVSIVGAADVAVSGLREVVDLLKETPAKGFTEPYDPTNFDEEFSEDYGGFGVPVPRGGPVWEGPRGGGGYHAPPARDNFRSPRFNRDSGGPLVARGGGGGGGGGGGDSNRTQVTVPKELAGAIIGKGGSRIRRVRSESGAEVTIDESTPNSPDRVITIKGNPDQIQFAQYLLQQAVRESQEGAH